MFSDIKRFLKQLKPFKSAVMWYVVITILYEVLKIGDSLVLGGTLALLNEDKPTMAWILYFVALILYDEAFMRMDNQVDNHIFSRITFPIFTHLWFSAIEKLLLLDMPWHRKNKSGAQVAKVRSAVQKTQDLVGNLSWDFIPTLIQFGLNLPALLFFSRYGALAIVLSLSIFMYLSYLSNRARKEMRKERHDLQEELSHRMVEDVQAIETVQMFVQEDRMLEEHKLLLDRVEDIGKREMHQKTYVYNRWRIRITTVARRLLLVLWVMQLLSGELSVFVFIFLYTQSEKLFHSFWRFDRLLDLALESWESISRFLDLMDEVPVVPNSGTVTSGDISQGIVLKGVGFSYDGTAPVNGNAALKDIDLTLEQDSVVALVGPSGAGKSSLRYIVLRAYDHHGEMSAYGVPLKEWDLKSWRRNIAIVPQGEDVSILARTIRDNIIFGKPDATEEDMILAAQRAALHDFIVTELPDGYDTLLGEKGHRLSGGQRQRLAFARAICADPKIFIFDEPTSALDAVTEHKIWKDMIHICEGKTVLLIAHRLSTVQSVADEIVVMDKGKIIERGTHSELMQNAGLYTEMVRLQQSH